MSKKNQNYTNRKQNRFQPERMRGNVFVNNSGKQWLPRENGREAKVERLLRVAKEEKKEIAGNMAGYKDSGIEWIGEIPKGWNVSKIGYHLKWFSKKNEPDKEVLSVYRELGVVKKNERDDNHNRTPLDLTQYKYVRPGDLVINKMKAWQGSVGVSDFEGIVSPAYFVYEFTSKMINKKYLHHLLRGCYKDEMMRLSDGIRVGQWDLSSYKFERMPIILPPLHEQQRIADFLDTKCSILDRTIDAVSRQIEDLEKYKKALITKTVTKGICKKGEPERAMKDSGVEWIGEVPEEWSVKRLKYVLNSIRNGASAASYEYEPDSFRYVRITDIDDNGNLKQTGKQYLPKEMAKNFILNKKAVLIANTGSLGKAMLFDPDKEDEVCALNGHLIEAIANPNIISNEYLYFFIKSYNYINWVNRSYVQTTMQMLSAGRHKNLPVTVPPLAEQQQIADYLDKKCKNIDNRAQKRRQQLEWLKEYKKSLIFDYVTGKKRVKK